MAGPANLEPFRCIAYGGNDVWRLSQFVPRLDDIEEVAAVSMIGFRAASVVLRLLRVA
jgi:hypothetical protein